MPAEAVLAGVLDNKHEDLTATQALRDAQDFPTSMPRLFSLWKIATREQVFPAYDRALKARLGQADYDRYLADPERPVLHHQLRGAQLGGHDVDTVLDRAAARDMSGARSIAGVLHGRIRAMNLAASDRTTTWAERTPHIDDPDHARIARATAEAMDHRQLELGVAAGRPPVTVGGALPRHAAPRARARCAMTGSPGPEPRPRTGIWRAGPTRRTPSAPTRSPARPSSARRGRTRPGPWRCSRRRSTSARPPGASWRPWCTAYERARAVEPAHVAADLEETSVAEANARATASLAGRRQPPRHRAGNGSGAAQRQASRGGLGGAARRAAGGARGRRRRVRGMARADRRAARAGRRRDGRAGRTRPAVDPGGAPQREPDRDDAEIAELSEIPARPANGRRPTLRPSPSPRRSARRRGIPASGNRTIPRRSRGCTHCRRQGRRSSPLTSRPVANCRRPGAS